MEKITPLNQEKYPNVEFIWTKDRSSPLNKVLIGENVVFRGVCTIYWGCEIGNNCAISHYAVIRENTTLGNNTKVGNSTTLDGHINVGNDVSIHTNCFIANNTIISDKVFIGPGCTITNVRRIKHGRNFPLIEESMKIGFGARIGGGCTLLPGISIGREALIGAGSIVTKNIPEFAIAIGVPTIIKGKISDEELLV